MKYVDETLLATLGDAMAYYPRCVVFIHVSFFRAAQYNYVN
jgi:hypothetical protein